MKLHILLFFLLFILSLPIFAQMPSQNANVLPVPFKCNSLIDVFREVGRLRELEENAEKNGRAAKEEFETTPQFEARKTKLIEENNRLKSSVAPRELCSIVNNQSFVYDADTESLTIQTLFNHNDSSTDTFLESTNESKTYQASNAFGVTVDVKREISNTYFLSFLNDMPEPAAVYVVNMNVEAAKSLKNNLRTLCFYKLIAPYSESWSSSSKPTISSPYENFISKTNVKAKLTQVWFFNAATGEIIVKHKI